MYHNNIQFKNKRSESTNEVCVGQKVFLDTVGNWLKDEVKRYENIVEEKTFHAPLDSITMPNQSIEGDKLPRFRRSPGAGAAAVIELPVNTVETVGK